MSGRERKPTQAYSAYLAGEDKEAIKQYNSIPKRKRTPQEKKAEKVVTAFLVGGGGGTGDIADTVDPMHTLDTNNGTDSAVMDNNGKEMSNSASKRKKASRSSSSSNGGNNNAETAKATAATSSKRPSHAGAGAGGGGAKKAASSSSSSSASSNKKRDIEAKVEKIVVQVKGVTALSLKDRLQDEVELRLVNDARVRNDKKRSGKKSLILGTQEPEDMDHAVRMSVEQCSTLLRDWSTPQAKFIGSRCKVYWDEDMTWFPARVLNYDSFYDRHFIYYFSDNTAEWIKFKDEVVLVCDKVAIVQLSSTSTPWPAMVYWMSPKAEPLIKGSKAYKKNCLYCEYFNRQKEELGYALPSQIKPIIDDHMPKESRRSAKFNDFLERARDEVLTQMAVVETVKGMLSERFYDALSGKEWLGQRVRAFTYRADDPRLTQRPSGPKALRDWLILRRANSFKCEGTIAHYSATSGAHMVIFDMDYLQPQWVSCDSGGVELLLGCDNNNDNEGEGQGQGQGHDSAGDRTRPVHKDGQEPNKSAAETIVGSAAETAAVTGVSAPDSQIATSLVVSPSSSSISVEGAVVDERKTAVKNTVVAAAAVKPRSAYQRAVASFAAAVDRANKAAEARNSGNSHNLQHSQSDLKALFQNRVDIDCMLCGLGCSYEEYMDGEIRRCQCCTSVCHESCLPPAGDIAAELSGMSLAESDELYKIGSSSGRTSGSSSRSSRYSSGDTVGASGDTVASAAVGAFSSSSSALDGSQAIDPAAAEHQWATNPYHVPASGVRGKAASSSHRAVRPWTCWLCIHCHGCGVDSVTKPLVQTTGRRLSSCHVRVGDAPVPAASPLHPAISNEQEPIYACGDCMHGFKYQKISCPVCLKFFKGHKVEAKQLSPVKRSSTGNRNTGGKSLKGSNRESSGAIGLAALLHDVNDRAVVAVGEGRNESATNNNGHAGEGQETTLQYIHPEDVINERANNKATAEGVVADGSADNYDDDDDGGPDQVDNQMVQCNECSRWVHAECEGMDNSQYLAVAAGTHPIWGDEYLCPCCRINLTEAIVEEMRQQDMPPKGLGVFARPVTSFEAKNYYDIIHNPMDLTTMTGKASRGYYKSIQVLRQDLELMCLNALVFNKPHDEYWVEARRFINVVHSTFTSLPRKSSHTSVYGIEINEMLHKLNLTAPGGLKPPKPVENLQPPVDKKQSGGKNGKKTAEPAIMEQAVIPLPAAKKPKVKHNPVVAGTVYYSRFPPRAESMASRAAATAATVGCNGEDVVDEGVLVSGRSRRSAANINFKNLSQGTVFGAVVLPSGADLNALEMGGSSVEPSSASTTYGGMATVAAEATYNDIVNGTTAGSSSQRNQKRNSLDRIADTATSGIAAASAAGLAAATSGVSTAAFFDTKAPLNGAASISSDSGNKTGDIVLPRTLTAPLDCPAPYLNCITMVQSAEDAFYTSAMDACLLCGSSGAADFLLFCVDCGEAFHSFCCDAPIAHMTPDVRANWRCLNCKICECCRGDPRNDDVGGELLYCDNCDMAYHANCLEPTIREPREKFFCPSCVQCTCVHHSQSSMHKTAIAARANKLRNLNNKHASSYSTASSVPSCWGFELDTCRYCHLMVKCDREEAIINKEKAEKEREEALLEAQIRHLQSLFTCKICKESCRNSFLRCAGCGTASHRHCNPISLSLEVETVFGGACKTIDNSMFLCDHCIQTKTAENSATLTSHLSALGSASQAMQVLAAVSAVQRSRTAVMEFAVRSNLQKQKFVLSKFSEQFREYYKIVLEWAFVRIAYMSNSSALMAMFPTSGRTGGLKDSYPDVKIWVRNRAVRFLNTVRVIRRRSPRRTDQELHAWMLTLAGGVNPDTNHRLDTVSLGRLATGAAAFISVTSMEWLSEQFTFDEMECLELQPLVIKYLRKEALAKAIKKAAAAEKVAAAASAANETAVDKVSKETTRLSAAAAPPPLPPPPAATTAASAESKEAAEAGLEEANQQEQSLTLGGKDATIQLPKASEDSISAPSAPAAASLPVPASVPVTSPVALRLEDMNITPEQVNALTSTIRRLMYQELLVDPTSYDIKETTIGDDGEEGEDEEGGGPAAAVSSSRYTKPTPLLFPSQATTSVNDLSNSSSSSTGSSSSSAAANIAETQETQREVAKSAAAAAAHNLLDAKLVAMKKLGLTKAEICYLDPAFFDTVVPAASSTTAGSLLRLRDDIESDHTSDNVVVIDDEDDDAEINYFTAETVEEEKQQHCDATVARAASASASAALSKWCVHRNSALPGGVSKGPLLLCTAADETQWQANNKAKKLAAAAVSAGSSAAASASATTSAGTKVMKSAGPTYAIAAVKGSSRKSTGGSGSKRSSSALYDPIECLYCSSSSSSSLGHAACSGSATTIPDEENYYVKKAKTQGVQCSENVCYSCSTSSSSSNGMSTSTSSDGTATLSSSAAAAAAPAAASMRARSSSSISSSKSGGDVGVTAASKQRANTPEEEEEEEERTAECEKWYHNGVVSAPSAFLAGVMDIVRAKTVADIVQRRVEFEREEQEEKEAAAAAAAAAAMTSASDSGEMELQAAAEPAVELERIATVDASIDSIPVVLAAPPTVAAAAADNDAEEATKVLTAAVDETYATYASEDATALTVQAAIGDSAAVTSVDIPDAKSECSSSAEAPVVTVCDAAVTRGAENDLDAARDKAAIVVADSGEMQLQESREEERPAEEARASSSPSPPSPPPSSSSEIVRIEDMAVESEKKEKEKEKEKDKVEEEDDDDDEDDDEDDEDDDDDDEELTMEQLLEQQLSTLLTQARGQMPAKRSRRRPCPTATATSTSISTSTFSSPATSATVASCVCCPPLFGWNIATECTPAAAAATASSSSKRSISKDLVGKSTTDNDDNDDNNVNKIEWAAADGTTTTTTSTASIVAATATSSSIINKGAVYTSNNSSSSSISNHEDQQRIEEDDDEDEEEEDDGVPKWVDPRVCCFCHTGEGRNAAAAAPAPAAGRIRSRSGSRIGAVEEDTEFLCGEQYMSVADLGRLLPFSDGSYVHVNCLRWSTDIQEPVDGTGTEIVGQLKVRQGNFTFVDGDDEDKSCVDVREKALKQRCFYCKRNGASVACCIKPQTQKARCRRVFHLRCAVSFNCALLEVRPTIVSENKDAGDTTTAAATGDAALTGKKKRGRKPKNSVPAVKLESDPKVAQQEAANKPPTTTTAAAATATASITATSVPEKAAAAAAAPFEIRTVMFCPEHCFAAEQELLYGFPSHAGANKGASKVPKAISFSQLNIAATNNVLSLTALGLGSGSIKPIESSRFSIGSSSNINDLASSAPSLSDNGGGGGGDDVSGPSNSNTEVVEVASKTTTSGGDDEGNASIRIASLLSEAIAAAASTAADTESRAAVAAAAAMTIGVGMRFRQWKPREPIRCLMISDNQDSNSQTISDLLAERRTDKCVRSGSCTILSIGCPVVDRSDFHCREYIYPHRFRSARIFYSMKHTARRTMYLFDILKDTDIEEMPAEHIEYVHRELEKNFVALGIQQRQQQQQQQASARSSSSALLFSSSNGVYSRSDCGASTATGSATSAPATSAASSTIIGSTTNGPIFRVVAMDNPAEPIYTYSIHQAYALIRQGVAQCVAAGERAAALKAGIKLRKAVTRMNRDTYGLNPHQFFGLGLPFVRRAIELIPESIAAMVTAPPHPQYRPSYKLPSGAAAAKMQQIQLTAKLAGAACYSVNGSARASELDMSLHRPPAALIKSSSKKNSNKQVRQVGGGGGGGALAKQLTGGSNVPGAFADNPKNISSSSSALKKTSSSSSEGAAAGWAQDGDEAGDDDGIDEERNEMIDLVERAAMQRQSDAQKYRELSTMYLRNPYAKLDVRKSRIHGWGLFAKINFSKGDFIVEYIGEKIRQTLADRREAQYEEEGVGSCYLFRLDKDAIVDATRSGGMARFMNHCCEPNAQARVVSSSSGGSGSSSGGTAEVGDAISGTSSITALKKRKKRRHRNVTSSDFAAADSGSSGETLAVVGDTYDDLFKDCEDEDPDSAETTDRHIIIIAARDIQEGEEIMYDYKFPIEDDKLKCFCGAPKCRGTMN